MATVTGEVVQRGKGFGFMSRTAGGADVFAHYCESPPSFRELRKVRSDLRHHAGQKGPQAENIVPT